MFELTPAPPFRPLPAVPAPPPPPAGADPAEAEFPPRSPAPLVPPTALFATAANPPDEVIDANCDCAPSFPFTPGQV